VETDMAGYLLRDATLPFAIAIGLMFALLALELLLFLLAGISLHAMDAPDFEIVDPGHADFDALSKVLGWFNVGKVPALVMLILFSSTFGMVGFTIQAFAESLLGRDLHVGLASAIAVVVALLALRFLGTKLAKFLPRDETQVVERKSFTGELATITVGTASYQHPAEAVVKDVYGQAHYIMVEPQYEGDVFVSGTRVVLTARTATTFKAVATPQF
jgi:hypothetical protein